VFGQVMSSSTHRRWWHRNPDLHLRRLGQADPARVRLTSLGNDLASDGATASVPSMRGRG